MTYNPSNTMIRQLMFLLLLLPYAVVADVPEDYYKGVDGKKKAALKAAMHDVDVKVTALSIPDALPFITEDGTRQEMTNGKSFDITGRQVPRSRKGIVIRNRRKVLQR